MFSIELLLQQFTQNSVERDIIKTCISYGFVSVGTIARNTGHPRTTINDNILKLVKSGYLVTQMGARGSLYGLASISSIERMLYSRIDSINEEINLFKNLGSVIQSHQFLGSHIPKITYHEGRSAIKTVYDSIYSEENVMGIFDPSASVESGVWTEKELFDYFLLTNGNVRDILVDSAMARKCSKIKKKNVNHHILIVDLPCKNFDMLLMNNTVYHISFHEPLVMIEIHGSVYYQVQKMMFEVMWSKYSS